MSLRIVELCVYSSKRPGKQLVVQSGEERIHFPQRELRNCAQNAARDLAVRVQVSLLKCLCAAKGVATSHCCIGARHVTKVPCVYLRARQGSPQPPI